MELYLGVFLKEDKTFEVNSQLLECIECLNSIIIIDYKATPWPRKEGNLLW